MLFCAVEGKPRGVAPCPHQRLCLWTPRRVFDLLDTHFAMELSALSGYARVLIRARRREIPCICEKAATVTSPTAWSRPFGATICKEWIKQLGGAPAGARSYWQGRFAACTFVDFSFGMVARETVGALPQTPQGAPVDCQASATPKKTSKGVRQPNLLRGL